MDIRSTPSFGGITINAARRMEGTFDRAPGIYRTGSKVIGVCGDKMAVELTDFTPTTFDPTTL